MKILGYFLLLLIMFVSCEKDCAEKPGVMTEREFEVPAFSKIIVNHGVEVYISEKPIQKVVVKTGRNKMDNIYFEVVENTLTVKADGTCIFSASYDPIQVFIASPHLTSIRNAGSFTVFSEGTLTYPNLELLSENYQTNYANIGNFDMQVANDSLKIISNGFSNFNISGATNYLYLGYFSGYGLFEGRNLVAQHIDFYHRGENTLRVFPVQSLRGEFYSVGNMISYHHPPIVEVSQHYTGKLIFD